ncbi:DUF3307 domain-containing protein [Marinigracilibium pacificum]|uniref:DUF3307 domain-containing protein n=1 Tax=Marinigracilibium pacificum TaxID=2729599 RepID=A0A848J4X3_9BACT|nr:DUF3307 domain-containing protein [Marinigracilibium pacificum]NMM48212.1 DUF3307 domain-containing protein [Marinigracilibium pacificum]
MTLLLLLLIAHLLGDFVFQPGLWAKDKLNRKIKSKWLYFHVLVHGVLAASILLIDSSYWWIPMVIIITHYGIDLSKAYLEGKVKPPILLIIDQVLHISVLTLIVKLTGVNISISIDYDLNSVLLFLMVILMVTYMGAVFVKITIASWSPSSFSDSDDSLVNAGRYIGIMERLFVFIFIITNHWEGIGFLLAAKSVFRFGDLKEAKDRKLTEYMLIGTLVSFGIGIIGGISYLYFIDLL